MENYNNSNWWRWSRASWAVRAPASTFPCNVSMNLTQSLLPDFGELSRAACGHPFHDLPHGKKEPPLPQPFHKSVEETVEEREMERGWLGPRKINPERTSPPNHAIHLDPSPVLPGDFIDCGRPQSDFVCPILGGKSGLRRRF